MAHNGSKISPWGTLKASRLPKLYVYHPVNRDIGEK